MIEKGEVRIRPTAKPKSVAEYLSWQINLCGKKQLEIAEEVGFPKPNVINMIKQGKTKLPLDKIGRFAKAIEVDPVHLFKLCMQEYMPETWREIERMMSQPVLTTNELEFIEIIRESNVINPRLHTDSDKERFRNFVETLHSDNERR